MAMTAVRTVPKSLGHGQCHDEHSIKYAGLSLEHDVRMSKCRAANELDKRINLISGPGPACRQKIP